MSIIWPRIWLSRLSHCYGCIDFRDHYTNVKIDGVSHTKFTLIHQKVWSNVEVKGYVWTKKFVRTSTSSLMDGFLNTLTRMCPLLWPSVALTNQIKTIQCVDKLKCQRAKLINSMFVLVLTSILAIIYTIKEDDQ